MVANDTVPTHIPIREAWLALRQERILEPELPIVDAHHHLWDRPDSRYMLPDFLLDLNTGHNVRASVYVQCRSMYRRTGPLELQPIGEVEFATEVAAMSASGPYGNVQICAGIVGCADLLLGIDVMPILEALLRAGGDHLRGIRNPVAWHESDSVRSSPERTSRGMMETRSFQNGVSCLARFGLSLDIWVYHTQLAEVLHLARAVPNVKIVLDHLGGPIGVGPYAGERTEVFSSWNAGMERLARLPNVYVKLGGLGMRVSGHTFHLRPLPPTSFDLAEAWRPYVHKCIDLFGVNRCMFESNFPVDKGMYNYAVLWNAFKRLASGCSATEKASLFGGTATSVYRLTAVSSEARGATSPTTGADGATEH